MLNMSDPYENILRISRGHLRNHLDERKHQILETVVVDYTRTHVPVGSQLVAAHLAAWSSATIRNELANLVEDGYLIQPHTSSGRVPSDQGYRYYVNFIMEEEPISAEVKLSIDRCFRPSLHSLDELLESAAEALATATEAVGIIACPQVSMSRIKHLDLVELEEPGKALLLVVLDGNVVRERVIALPGDVDQEGLSELALDLARSVRGLSVHEIPSRVPVNPVSGMSEGDGIRAAVLGELAGFLHDLDAERGHWVIHDGVRNLLRQPEFDDIAKLGQVMEVLEEEQIIAKLLEDIDRDARKIPGVRIIIGRENEVEQLTHCSLVFTSFRIDSSRFGTIGILGPTRMYYSQVAPRVRYVAQRVETSIHEQIG